MEIFKPAKIVPIGNNLSISDMKSIWFIKSINIDFSCNISHTEFNEWYEQYKKYIDSDVTISFNHNYEPYKCLIKNNQSDGIIEPVIFKDKEKKITFNAVNYIRYLIITTIWFNENYSDTKQTEVGLLLMWNVTDVFIAEWEKWKLLLEEIHNSPNDNTYTQVFRWFHKCFLSVTHTLDLSLFHSLK